MILDGSTASYDHPDPSVIAILTVSSSMRSLWILMRYYGTLRMSSWAMGLIEAPVCYGSTYTRC
ncbi:hypothetical protein BDD12DRAFT_828788, partial [Trichophaea hybrida]